MTPHFRADKALAAIGALFRPGDVVEIRALHVDRKPTFAGSTHSGYFEFEAGEAIAKALKQLNGRAEGIYVVLNPLNRDLLARANNRLQTKPKSTTTDADIIQWRWLYIDCDPNRPSGISSTDAQHESALERAAEIRSYLVFKGWPEPIYCDSGNGAHLLYLLPGLELDDAARLVKACLKALALRFSDESVTVDESTCNASRICKLYGTQTRKGDPMPDRPHRYAAILEEPEHAVPVSVAALEALALEVEVVTAAPKPTQERRTSPDGSFNIDEWVGASGFEVIRGPEAYNGGRRWILRCCPFDPTHEKPAIIELADGPLVYKCLHNSCKEKDWHALRDLVEPGWQSQRTKGGMPNPQTNSAWEPPIPFHQFKLPLFPTEVFPGWLRNFVEAEATATQTPVDLAGMLVLSVLAAACAKKVIVQVKPGYCEPVNIFTVTALSPANRKSAVFGAVKKPVADFEREENKKASPEMARQRTERKIKEATLKKLQDQAVSATGPRREELIKQAGELAIEMEEATVATPIKLIVDDCTSEKLPGILREQGGRCAVLSPEGDIFEVMGGRYSNNQTSNIGVYLKGHSGDDLRVDRVGRPSEHVPAPAITIGLTVQPEVIRGMAAKPGFRGRGLIGRILFSMPHSLLGHRKTNPPPLPDDVVDAYNEGVLALLRIPLPKSEDGESTPHALKIDPAGSEQLQQFEQWVEPQLSEFGELGHLTDWAGKLVGAVARIAGLLHMAQYAGGEAPWDILISETTVGLAICLGKYLIPHAHAAFAEIGADEVVEKAKAVLRWIGNHDTTSFTRRDVHQGMRGLFRRVIELDAPLVVLIERGFIRKRSEKTDAGAGRPQSPTFDVNPQWTTNSEYCEDFEKATQENGSGSPRSQEPSEKTELE